MLVHLKTCNCALAFFVCIWQTECVSGQMLCDVVLSYSMPEWDRISAELYHAA